MTSVETLTSFATTCDTKLENCCVRIQKMEAALVLVEKKLCEDEYLTYFNNYLNSL